jgi:hypothetical protein
MGGLHQSPCPKLEWFEWPNLLIYLSKCFINLPVHDVICNEEVMWVMWVKADGVMDIDASAYREILGEKWNLHLTPRHHVTDIWDPIYVGTRTWTRWEDLGKVGSPFVGFELQDQKGPWEGSWSGTGPGIHWTHYLLSSNSSSKSLSLRSRVGGGDWGDHQS